MLCQRAAARDEQAFELLVARYYQRAYRLAWSILRDAEEARDVSQEAFIRLHETAGSFAGRARFSTWFYRVLVNLCLDRRRKLRWWRRLVVTDGPDDGDGPRETLDRVPAPAGDPLDGLEREQAVKRLWAAVDGLSPQQRAAVVLLVQEELPTSEVAAVLGCSETTVRVHLHRALAALRKRVAKE